MVVSLDRSKTLVDIATIRIPSLGACWKCRVPWVLRMVENVDGVESVEGVDTIGIGDESWRDTLTPASFELSANCSCIYNRAHHTRGTSNTPVVAGRVLKLFRLENGSDVAYNNVQRWANEGCWHAKVWGRCLGHFCRSHQYWFRINSTSLGTNIMRKKISAS